MQGIVDSLIARYVPSPEEEAREQYRRHCAEKPYREHAIRVIWGVYLADFFPVPVEPVGDWDDCLDKWADAPAENICLAISQAKRRYGHLKNKNRKKAEICEFIGRIARFGTQTYGMSPHERDTTAVWMAREMKQFVTRQIEKETMTTITKTLTPEQALAQIDAAGASNPLRQIAENLLESGTVTPETPLTEATEILLTKYDEQ